MTSKTLYNISTQQIQIFLKAVELKNFTQVANHFNFTPSMVSKTISALEAELELPLFVRKPHYLAPTSAAVFLAKEWRQTMTSINNSIQKAHLCANGQRTSIVLGFVDSSVNMDLLITDSVRDYTAKYNGVNITIEKHDMHRAAELLNHGLLDIIITSAMEIPYLDEHNLCWEKIIDTDVAAFVPGACPLFQRETLSFEDLCGQTFISLNPTMHPTYNAFFLKICSKYGISPNVAATYRTVRSLMFSLKLHDYIFIGDSINSDWADEDLKMFLLPEKSFSIIAWRDHDGDTEVRNFKDYLKRIYKKHA